MRALRLGAAQQPAIQASWGTPDRRRSGWRRHFRNGVDFPQRLSDDSMLGHYNVSRFGSAFFAPHARRRQLHRLIDLDVAGAAAKVFPRARLDFVARGFGIDWRSASAASKNAACNSRIARRRGRRTSLAEDGACRPVPSPRLSGPHGLRRRVPAPKHDSTGVPSSSTVQVPHSPSSQPCFVPVSPRSSRKTSSSVFVGRECDFGPLRRSR